VLLVLPELETEGSGADEGDADGAVGAANSPVVMRAGDNSAPLLEKVAAFGVKRFEGEVRFPAPTLRRFDCNETRIHK
jgi:hypothetical protein